MEINVVILIKVCYTNEVSYQQCLSTASSLFAQGAFFYLIRKVLDSRSKRMAEGNSLEVCGFQSHLFCLYGRHKLSWNACNPI